MIEVLAYTAVLFFCAIVGSYLITLRKQFIEMRKQIAENEFEKTRS